MRGAESGSEGYQGFVVEDHDKQVQVFIQSFGMKCSASEVGLAPTKFAMHQTFCLSAGGDVY